MPGSKRIPLFLLLSFCVLVSQAQQALTFQVLIAERANVGRKAVSQFDNLLPGDTVVVEKSGYLALISNYYHSIELTHDTVFVLPDFGVEEVGEAYKRPDLRGLFSKQRFGWNSTYGAVEHASYFMDLLFPLLPNVVYSGDGITIPIIWNDNRSEDEKKEKITVRISTIFDEDIVEFHVEGESICLDLSHYPNVLDTLQRHHGMIVSFEFPHLNGRDFAIKLSGTKNWQAPISTCKTSSATSAVALAMLLENNHGYFRDGNTEYYYHLATKLSTNPQYLKIYERYLSRKAGK